MSCLSFPPSVFVIGQSYELLLFAEQNGIFWVEVNGERYYPDNAGTLASELPYAKVRLPQTVLDGAKNYRVCYRKTIVRRAYFSEIGEVETADFAFHPLTKTRDIHLYHIADVHYAFAVGKKTATYFGDDLDLLVVNGDIGEVETEQNYKEVARFVGEITGGSLPVLFVRGNHDTRGHLAEKYTDYFPAEGKNTYFTFEVGPLCGVALDCGEDKPDNHREYGGGYGGAPVYNGTNAFEPYRRRETDFLRGVTLPQGKIPFAVCHICPVQTTERAGNCFDIEREVYTEWNAELERLGIYLMLCGHVHRAYMLMPGDPASLLPHNYPVVVGSATFKGQTDLVGAAITLSPEGATVLFTDAAHNVKERFELTF